MLLPSSRDALKAEVWKTFPANGSQTLQLCCDTQQLGRIEKGMYLPRVPFEMVESVGDRDRLSYRIFITKSSRTFFAIS